MDTPDEITGNMLADLALGLRDWALSQWEITLLLALFALFRWWFANSYAEADSRAGLIAFLRHAQAANAYKLMLSWLLDRTDRWCLSPRQYARRPQDRPAWSVKLYDRTLVLAVIYPILSVYAVWAITDRNAPFGDTVLIFGDKPWQWRLTAMFALAGTVALTAAAATRTTRHARILWLGLCVVFASAATAVISVRVTGEDIVGGAVSFGGAVAGGYVFAGIIAVACTGAVVFQARVAGVFAFAGVATISLIGGIEGQRLYPIAEAIGGFVGRPGMIVEVYATLFVLLLVGAALTSALVVSGIVFAALNQTGRGVRVYVGLTLLIAGALLLGWSQRWAIASNLLFLATLPLLNAIFDFSSIGLTRWALRRGIRRIGGSTLGYAILDLAGASLLFLGLGCAGVLAIHTLNAVATEPVLLLAGGDKITPDQCQDGFAISPNLFHAIRTCPGDYWWLYVTFLSTILPTLVHSMVALWVIGPAILSGRIRRWAAQTLQTSERHFGRRWVALSIVSAWSAFAVAAPLVVLFWAGGWVASDHPDWGLALVDFFEGFYQTLPGA